MKSVYLAKLQPFLPLAGLPISATVLIILAWIGYRWTLRTKRLPYPPGPKPSLFVGNVKDFPATQPWLTFTEWKQVYGDIIHLELLGQHYIVLNSLEATKELLEARSSIYSDRPRYILAEIMNFNRNTAFLPYGTEWRKHRNIFHNAIVRTAGLHSLRPIYVKKVKELLRNLLASPEDFMAHNKTFSAAIIMAVVYGHDIASQNDIYVEVAEVVIEKIVNILASKSSLMMNAFPLLRFIPSWFPGAGAKRKALQGREQNKRMHDLPFELVQKQMAEGTANPSILSDLLQNPIPDDFSLIKEVAAAGYAGGADTTAATLSLFFYLMLLNPNIQAKAREQLDAVVGPDSLPTFEDLESLPYISAILKEVLRWMPVVPLGVFRRSSADDMYESYHIPKGAIIIPNIWAIHHNPNTYPNPAQFSPERFLNDQGGVRNDLEVKTFGFGRRACVGQYMASEVSWLAIASILHTFDIRPKKDLSGHDIIPEPKYNEGAVIRILPFECSVTPRSKASEHLIRSTCSKEDN